MSNARKKRHLEAMTEERRHFTTSSGRVVLLNPVSMLEINAAENGLRQEYLDAGEPIDPPTYTVKTAGGAEVTFAHDSTSINEGDPEQVAKNREAWQAYLRASNKLEIELMQLRNEIFFVDGIDDSNLENDDTGWEARQKKRHIKIPDDPDERKMHWVQTVLCKTPDDVFNLVQRIMLLSAGGMVSEETLEALGDTFRGSLQEESAEQWSGNASQTA